MMNAEWIGLEIECNEEVVMTVEINGWRGVSHWREVRSLCHVNQNVKILSNDPSSPPNLLPSTRPDILDVTHDED
jgi:hypothetical protein